MILDLSDMFADNMRSARPSDGGVSQTAGRKYTARLEMDTFDLGRVCYPIQDKSSIDLSVSRLDRNKVHIEGDVSLDLVIPCDRCLVDTVQKIEFRLDRDIDFEDEDGEEDTSFVEGHTIDVDGMLFPEILVNMPTKGLCKADCKGICKVCGTNLNRGTCECDTFVPDPRMAAISDIFAEFSNK